MIYTREQCEGCKNIKSFKEKKAHIKGGTLVYDNPGVIKGACKYMCIIQSPNDGTMRCANYEDKEKGNGVHCSSCKYMTEQRGDNGLAVFCQRTKFNITRSYKDGSICTGYKKASEKDD